jgi:hypothetical protein
MREVIDQEGRWKLVRCEHAARYASWVTHDCPDRRNEFMEFDPRRDVTRAHFASCHSDQKCSICGEKIPPRLIALWTLHNFDYIQEGGL